MGSLIARKKKIMMMQKSDYQFLDYVYCDGSLPYIEITDHIGEPSITMIVKVKKDSNITNEAAFVGSKIGNPEFELYYVAGRSTFDVWPFGTVTLVSASYSDQFDILQAKWAPSSRTQIRLVGRFRNYTVNYVYTGKIFEYTELDSNDNVIHHLVPCVSPENIVGFYDTIEKKFYGPASSSVFVAGSKIN